MMRTWYAFNKMFIVILFLLVTLPPFIIVTILPIIRSPRSELLLLALAFIGATWGRWMIVSIDRESMWSDVSVISSE